MTKESELIRAKRLAVLLLIAVTVTFFVTIFLPGSLLVNGIKAMSEAAMVGALADWFAVAALFKRIPTPFPFITSHTAIIPNNKNRIADNLALFIEEKFLGRDSVVKLVNQHNPADLLTQWLSVDANVQKACRYLVQLIGGLLQLFQDERIQLFIQRAAAVLMDKVDVSKSLGAIIDGLTKEGRHQELLDMAIGALKPALQSPTTRALIASRILEWLKTEHPKKEKVLPSEWIADNGAQAIADAVEKFLERIRTTPDHEMRAKFDVAVQNLAERLKEDIAFAKKGDELKASLKDSEALNGFAAALWTDLSTWIRQDLNRSDSLIYLRLVKAGRWMGKSLAADPQIRNSLNEHMKSLAETLAPDVARFLKRHISDTIKNWDADDLARQIEVNIGKDLQAIRVNGTVVGGVIGLVLYLTSLAPGLMR